MPPTEAPGPDAHPNDDLLLAHHDGVLYSGDRALVESHLKSCGRCRARLTALTEDITPVQTPAAQPARTGPSMARRLVQATVLLAALAALGIFAWGEIGRRAVLPGESSQVETTLDLNPAPLPPDVPAALEPEIVAADAPPPAETAPAVEVPAEPAPATEPTPPPPPPVNALVITSPNREFRWRVVGRDVERTNNGGRDWLKQNVSLTAAITAGTAPNAAVCWLVGQEGTVFAAVGGTWRAVPLPEPADLVRVAALDSMNATITATDGRQFSTSDGGATWNEVQ